MHDFKFKRGQLYCENVPVARVVRELGTPLYLYSYKTIMDHFRKLKTALAPVDPLICFSMKANSNMAICRALVKEGAGLDVVSGGELYKALKIGVSPKKIVYASVGKTQKEIEAAVRAGILFFNVESLPELRLIDLVCKRSGKIADVSLRVNPDVDPRTHHFITTAKTENKFGIDLVTAKDIFLRYRLFPNLRLSGVHVHIGSQITKPKPFIEALTKVKKLIKELEENNVPLRYLNIGGGLGIIYKQEKPQTAKDFARVIVPILKQIGLKVILEPGRFIVGNAGILVTKVTYLKKTKVKNFIIVDAGMNDLIRPCLYDAHHEIVPVASGKGRTIKADIVGPICESSDYLGKARIMREPRQGELLAVMSAGAYGFSMSSNYNSRPRAAEALVVGNKYYLIRKRETYEDLIRGEIIPKIAG